MKKLISIFFIFCFFNGWAVSYSLDTITERDTSVLSSQGNWVPFVMYGDETSWGGGVLYCYHFPSFSAIRVSNVQSSVTYTLKEQIIFSVISQYFTPNEKFRLSGELFASKFPNVFYGFGKDVGDNDEEQYTPLILRFSGMIENYLDAHWRGGIAFCMQYEDVIKVENGGRLSHKDLTGISPYWISGMGFVLGYDSRDNIFMSSEGAFAEIKFQVFHPWLCSELDYRRLDLDLRRFVPFSDRRSLALQIYMSHVWGNTPFQQLCQIGGPNLLRGFLQGKYRDNFMGVIQSEFRYGIYKRWGGVVFLSAGNVASSFKDYNVHGLKIGTGIGLRYRLNCNKTRIRFDYGVNNEGGTSIQFGVLEAF